MYTGDEEAVQLDTSSIASIDDIFDVRSERIPSTAVPIYDDALGAVIGYRYQAPDNMYELYDLDGNVVGLEEPGLSSPLIDPLDLIFFVGGIFRAIGRGIITGIVRTAPRVAATTAIRVTSGRLAVSVLGAMRSIFRGLTIRSLKFTATTSARMATSGRFVPVHILHLAIKYGRRVADPQGVQGAFQYTIKMFKNGRPYNLEVVVRESDWTILHFVYRSIR